ncbi:MAG TPA: hypothetical protein VLH61_10930 [Bacteroidales bacterium]|nr:hypothetical protein [Bacteroidales bacterium]
MTNDHPAFSLPLPGKYYLMVTFPDINNIFRISDEDSFARMALEVFAYQYENNTVYCSFCDALKRTPQSVKSLNHIPFLPVSFFQNNRVVAFDGREEKVFTSSGTTGTNLSKHFIYDLLIYERSFSLGFELFYGNPNQYAILALLPGYLERSDSSLIYMTDALIRKGANPASGFYLHNLDKLATTLQHLKKAGQRIILIGVSFALLDLAEKFPVKIPGAIIMETGGMKGKRKELVREELHEILKKAFGVETIHSEYGMTELLSQAYSMGNGIFACPPWMKVLICDVNDPLSLAGFGKTGGINIIDLANIHSCSFIATQDLGKAQPNGQFEVLGRFDHSAVRGCNLMVE